MSGVCSKCKEPISHRAVLALGKSWHPKHFTCSVCEQPIRGSSYSVLGDGAVCKYCHERHHVELCCCCDKPILERVISAVDGKWHENCFRCVNCAASLVNRTYFEVNGCIFCEDDFYKFFSARCAGCAKPIVTEALVALNTKWHHDCFKCKRCAQVIKPGKFAIQRGQAVCPKCAKMKMAGVHLTQSEGCKLRDILRL